VTEAVVSVPAYFAQAQRAATKRAGALAGLLGERRVNEPSAAAISARIGEGDADKTCLVFDLGGGTLDVSLVERFENVVSVTAVSGDNWLGGRDFDLAIAQGFCEDCGLDFQELSGQQQAMLLRQAESCKVALSSQRRVLMVFTDEKGVSHTVTLDNTWVVRKSSSLMKRLAEPIRRVLLDSGTPARAIDELVMVGGSSQMGSVSGYICGMLDRSPAKGVRPDTAVALGAAVCAGMKARTEGLRELVLTDVCPFTLGISIANHSDPSQPVMSPIIERNSVLPTSKMGVYCTVRDNQTVLDVDIYQGENRYCRDNTRLGALKISVPPAPRGQQSIQVRFTYDINGILEVEVLSEGGKTSRLLLKDGDVSNEEAQKRLAELAKLKLHPRDREQTRAVSARGERLFATTVGGLRRRIGEMMEWFQQEVESQEGLRLAKAVKRANEFFDRVDDMIQGTGLYGMDGWEEP
ncbi:MAG: Hsp70 family protein, partial [Oscillospiraceae bacterium]|nr:Hsp70 family protein [Oscillospiraceae bacterium]